MRLVSCCSQALNRAPRCGRAQKYDNRYWLPSQGERNNLGSSGSRLRRLGIPGDREVVIGNTPDRRDVERFARVVADDADHLRRQLADLLAIEQDPPGGEARPVGIELDPHEERAVTQRR